MIGSQVDLRRLKECCAPYCTVTHWQVTVYRDTVTKSPHFAGDLGRSSLAVTVSDPGLSLRRARPAAAGRSSHGPSPSHRDGE